MKAPYALMQGSPTSGTPDLSDQQQHKIRNNTHNKCNVLESAKTIPPPLVMWKNCLPQNWYLVPKRLGTTALMQPSTTPQTSYFFSCRKQPKKNVCTILRETTRDILGTGDPNI